MFEFYWEAAENMNVFRLAFPKGLNGEFTGETSVCCCCCCGFRLVSSLSLSLSLKEVTRGNRSGSERFRLKHASQSYWRSEEMGYKCIYL